MSSLSLSGFSGIQGTAERPPRKKPQALAGRKSVYIKYLIIVCRVSESTIKIFDSSDKKI
jgi:hypothetical protein